MGASKQLYIEESRNVPPWKLTADERRLREFEQEFNQPLNKQIMDPKNLKYLQDLVKFHGFGEKLFPEMEAKMKNVEKEFTLSIGTDMKDDHIKATLHFRKSSETEAYFFNKYEAVLIKSGQEPREQTFYLDKGKGFTMKEAYNLLDGRAVHKEFTNKDEEKYKAWRQLDLDSPKNEKGQYEVKQYSERYGYDIREALSYFPIREFMKADDSLNLVKALERGNLQPVVMDIDGQKKEFMVTADPKNRTLIIQDKEGRELTKTEKEELMLSPEAREQRMDEKVQMNTQGNGKEPQMVHEKPAEPKDLGKEQGKEVKNSKAAEKGKGKDLLPKGKDNGLLAKNRQGAKNGIKIQ